MLSDLFTMEEIQLVVKESDGNKSPDPDDFNFAQRILVSFEYFKVFEINRGATRISYLQ